MAVFPGGPGLAGTRMSPFWNLLELRMMEVVVTTGATRCAKLQSKCHHQQTNNQIFTGQMPFLSPTNSVTALNGKGLTFCFDDKKLHSNCANATLYCC